jgi:hypothetical protein
MMNELIHRIANRYWPVVLLAMFICTPWIVIRSYRELKAAGYLDDNLN